MAALPGRSLIHSGFDACGSAVVRAILSAFSSRKNSETSTVADMLVLPSLYTETWGLVMNEAMQFGVPCIVSDRVGCGPDLIRPGDTFHALCLKRVAGYSVQAAADWILDKALYL